jgi:hypothetical protein
MDNKEKTLELEVWDVEDILESKKKFSIKDDFEQLQYADKVIKEERRMFYELYDLG